MKMLAIAASAKSIRGRLTKKSATPLAKIADIRDNITVGQSYSTGMGMRNASMPVLCIDQTPKPIAVAPPKSQIVRTLPRARVMRPAKSSAAYEAPIAITTDRATSP